MLNRALLFSLAASALLLSGAVRAEEKARELLTVDTPVLELLLEPKTRPVVERLLPSLSKRILSDASAAELLGSSSPRELAIDPHVRGITEELLKRLQEELLAVQKR